MRGRAASRKRQCCRCRWLRGQRAILRARGALAVLRTRQLCIPCGAQRLRHGKPQTHHSPFALAARLTPADAAAAASARRPHVAWDLELKAHAPADVVQDAHHVVVSADGEEAPARVPGDTAHAEARDAALR